MHKNDTYGSLMRQIMKKSINKPPKFHPLNRRQESFDWFLCWTSFITGVLVLLAVILVVSHQISLRVHP